MSEGKNTTNTQPPKPTQPSNIVTLGEPVNPTPVTPTQPQKPTQPSNVVTKSKK